MSPKPVLLFYCQHSLGMGHLVRAFNLTNSLANTFEVVFINGGKFPDGFVPPRGITLLNLAPLGMDAESQLVSLDSRYSVEQAKARRTSDLLAALDRWEPAVIIVELFPFGRKKFTDEIVALLEAARSQLSQAPLVMCSLRDILVGSRKDQEAHDERAAALVNRYFDGVLVHADPAFARLEQTFRARTPLAAPVHYTGFVTAGLSAEPAAVRDKCVIVSAGGGIVGMPLFTAAVKAQHALWPERRVPMRIVAGPFLPEKDWVALRGMALDCPGLELVRSVPDLGREFCRVSACVSQCGYNTAMDILSSGVAALVVPFAEGREDEQMNRAERLSRLNLLRVLDPVSLSGSSLAHAIKALDGFQPGRVRLGLDGADTTTRLLIELLAQRGQRKARALRARVLAQDAA